MRLFIYQTAAINQSNLQKQKTIKQELFKVFLYIFKNINNINYVFD